MTRHKGTELLTRLLKHSRIGLGAFALMLLAASIHGSASAATVLAEVAHVSAEVVDAMHMIDARFALSEPVYRGTARGGAILILALVFSGIVGFNVWFFRHLHRVYTPLR
jgi:hypothetical protein